VTPRRGDARARELFAAAAAILSDLDGTLVDSGAPVRRAWSAFAVRHGLDPEQVLAFAHGRPSSETVRLLAPDADHGTESRLLEQSEVNDTDGVIALPGALELMSGPRRLAIVTSCSTALARARLAAAGLPEPSVMVTYDDVEQGKPDPSCFLIGARRLGVAPDRCVVLEDAPAGITAGRRAGASVIAVRTTYSDDQLGEADAIVDDLGALRAGEPRRSES
jgi:mannitol-1-/sugar-/sorbitol-6-phosphatase